MRNSTDRIIKILAAGGLVVFLALPVRAQVPSDSTRTSPHIASGQSVLPDRAFSPFDSIGTGEFRLRHALSLDHFLEYQPGYFVSRLGPIGADAVFSRYGMGGGRPDVFLGIVSLNDPQDGRAPLYASPLTAVERLRREDNAARGVPMHSSIEGTVELIPPEPSAKEPVTRVEGTTGNRGIRQARVLFSSAYRTFGIDFGLDELKNRGFQYTVQPVVNEGTQGQSSMREQTFDMRGRVASGNRYLFQFRRFDHSFNGNLVDGAAEQRKGGSYGLAQGWLGRTSVAVYQRAYASEVRRGASTLPPDSSTANDTTNLSLIAPFGDDDNSITLGVSYEDILSRQKVVGEQSDDDLEQARVGANGRLRLGRQLNLSFGVRGAVQVRHAQAWGGDVTIARGLGRGSSVSLLARRDFRLPALGELFVPLHNDFVTGTPVAGNSDLSAETSTEVGARLYTPVVGLENEVRYTLIRVSDPIGALQVGGVVRPANLDARNLQIIENRLRAHGKLFGSLTYKSVASIELAIGDREGYFAGVPEYKGHVEFMAGSVMFEGTSELYLTAEVQFAGERQSRGTRLGSFAVLNLRLNARLVDALLYIRMLNATQVEYSTVPGFLMTPRTMLYGIYWTFYS